ncbi:GNAT family N-acetyltransferase [Flavobacteriaceae bacterium LMO-SS05]
MSFQIETERIILRNMLPTDIEGMFELDSDPAVHKYLGNNPFKHKSQSEANIDDIIKQYETFGIGRWAMVNKQTNEFMGWSGLKFNTITLNDHSNFYDVGYRIIKRFWGKGYATESSIASLDYGFNILNLDTIYGITEKNNQASHQVLLKIGLHYIEDFYDKKANVDLRWYNISKS